MSNSRKRIHHTVIIYIYIYLIYILESNRFLSVQKNKCLFLELYYIEQRKKYNHGRSYVKFT